jgi:hypothetical protein
MRDLPRWALMRKMTTAQAVGRSRYGNTFVSRRRTNVGMALMDKK